MATVSHTLSRGNKRLRVNEYSTNPGFFPSDFPSCRCWLRADTGVFTDAAMTIPAANGDAVYTWATMSGSYNFIQATAGSRPQYLASVVNGLPALHFYTNANTRLEATHTTIPQPYTIFLVGQPIDTNLGTSYCSFFDGNNNYPQITWAKAQATTVPPWMWAGTGAPSTMWPAPSFTSFSYFTTVFNGVNSLGRINGSGSVCSTTPGAGGLENMRVGGSQYNSGMGLHCYIAEVAVFNIAFNTAQIIQVESYFKYRYNIGV